MSSSINWNMLDAKLDKLVSELQRYNDLITETKAMISFIAGEKRKIKDDIRTTVFELSQAAAVYTLLLGRWIRDGGSKDNIIPNRQLYEAERKLSRQDKSDLQDIAIGEEELSVRNIELRAMERELRAYKTQINLIQYDINELHYIAHYDPVVFQTTVHLEPVGRLLIKHLNIRKRTVKQDKVRFVFKSNTAKMHSPYMVSYHTDARNSKPLSASLCMQVDESLLAANT